MKATNNPSKYVFNNIDKLEEWSGKKYGSILFDSERDGNDSKIFKQKIMNQCQLYFIVIDTEEIVFGHYHPGVIDKTYYEVHDSKIFLFTINSNGRCGVIKFDSKRKDSFTCLYENENCYECGYGDDDDGESSYSVTAIDVGGSSVYNEIVKQFKGVKKTTLTGHPWPHFFTPKRLIVIQMLMESTSC